MRAVVVDDNVDNGGLVGLPEADPSRHHGRLDVEGVTLPRVPAALWRRACAGCGEEVVIPLGALDPVECDGCGLDYDPRTGEPLPVCEGLPPIPPAAAAATPPPPTSPVDQPPIAEYTA